MNTSAVEEALAAPGEMFTDHTEVEMLLVGGAAGMLTGELRPSRTTLDCDVMMYVPDTAIWAVERAAQLVGSRLQLPRTWLNSDLQIRRDSLPDHWHLRRVWIGQWGLLRVFAVSRIDLISMKVLAGRTQDLEDIRSMKPRLDDIAHVSRYLDDLLIRGTPPEQITEARTLLATLEPHHGD